MDTFDRVFTRISDWIAHYFCGGIALVMMIYVSVHVFSRYLLGVGGVPGTYAFVGSLLVPLIYLGLSYAWYKSGYVVVDILQARLKGRWLWGFQFAFLLLTLGLFAAVICYGAFLGTLDSYRAREFVGEIGAFTTPEWPWKASIVVGTFLMAIRNILDLARMLRTGEVVTIKDR